MFQQDLIREKQERSVLYNKDCRNSVSFNALEAWLELSQEVQEDFRKRGITKKDLEDAIECARRKKGRR